MYKTLREQVEALLKTGWYSNFQMNMKIKSSSADREARRIRARGVEGYEFKQRPKKKLMQGQRPCLEYTLQKITESEK